MAAKKRSVREDMEEMELEERGEEVRNAGEDPGSGETGAEGTAGRVKRVYIGPSLPFGILRQSMILEGTEEEIGEFVRDLLESYPEIPHLLVAPEELTEAMRKVERKGTILHKYYEDVLAKSRASRKG